MKGGTEHRERYGIQKRRRDRTEQERRVRPGVSKSRGDHRRQYRGDSSKDTKEITVRRPSGRASRRTVKRSSRDGRRGNRGDHREAQ